MLNGTYIAEVAEKFSEFNRFPTKTAPGSPFTLFLQGLLKDMSVAFKVQKYAATEVTLYSSKAETMSVYKVKPAMLDLYLFLTILGYLAVLWLVLKTCGKVSTSKSKRN